MRHGRIPVAAVMQQSRDAPVGVLQQILVDGALPRDRHQRIEVRIQHLVSGQLDRDERAMPHVENQVHEPAAVHHLDLVPQTDLVVAAAAQLRFVVAQAAVDVPAVVRHAALKSETAQDQRVHGRRDAADGEPIDSHAEPRAYLHAQYRLRAGPLDAGLDCGRQEAAITVEAPQRVGDRRRLIRAKRGTVGVGDGAAHRGGGDAGPPVDFDALDDPQRRQDVLQQNTVGQRAAVDRDILETAEAEQVSHALADLPHRKRLADAGLHHLEDRLVAQRAAVAHQFDADHRLADEVVEPGRRRRGGGRCGQQHAKRNEAPRRAPRERTQQAIRSAHQNACLTRKSRA